MAYAESDRVKIRAALGVAAVYINQYPRLESAITATQSIADGGSRPDSTTETAIKGYLTEIDNIDLTLKNLWEQASVGDAKGVVLDAARGAAYLRQEGRRYVHKVAAALSVNPLRDVYSASPLDDGSDAGGVRNVYK